MQIIPQSEDEIKMRVILISVLLKISLKISAEIFTEQMDASSLKLVEWHIYLGCQVDYHEKMPILHQT